MPAELPDTHCKAIRDEYEGGCNVREIARRHGLSRDQVYLRLRKAKTVLRSGGPRPAPVGATHAVGRGYIREKVPNNWPFLTQMRIDAGDGRERNWVFQHRKVMAEHLGRALTSTESVHHIDGDKANNAIENLQLMIAHPYGGHYRCRACGSGDIEAIKI